MPDSRPVPAAPADLTDTDLDEIERSLYAGNPDRKPQDDVWRLLADLRTARRERAALAAEVDAGRHEYVSGFRDCATCFTRHGSKRHRTSRRVLAELDLAAALKNSITSAAPATVPTTTGDPDERTS